MTTDEIILNELENQLNAWDKSIEYHRNKLKECEDCKARALRLIELLK